jgi:hypothetical protein
MNQQTTAPEQYFYRINFTLADDDSPAIRVAYMRATSQEHALLKLSRRYQHHQALPALISIDLAEGEFITD